MLSTDDHCNLSTQPKFLTAKDPIILTMRSYKYALYAFAAAVGVAGVPNHYGPHLREVSNVSPRQSDPGRFTTQLWGNEDSSYEWDGREGGEYAVVWDQPSSGNFVVGKGYRGQDM